MFDLAHLYWLGDKWQKQADTWRRWGERGLSYLHVLYVRTRGRARGGSREAWMDGGSCNCLQEFKDVYIIREALMGSNAK